MNHEEIRHKLSEFIDGAITPDEKTAIEQHLLTCTECADALRELRKTIEHIHAVEEVDPPAWMTQKIMAKVREEQEKQKSFWQRIFVPVFSKFPIQAVAVIFLAVTAYYIYQGINPSAKYSEEPLGTLAKKEAPAAKQVRKADKVLREAAPEQKQAPQKPGYKSLDMKDEYEKPSPPVPQDRMVASAPAQAKQEEQAQTANDVASTSKRAISPKASAPMMVEQATAPAAGAAKREAMPEEHKAKNFLSENKEADAHLDIAEHFVKFDLPQTMKQKGLQYSTRKFESGIADLAWIKETSAYRSKPCPTRYVVDVSFSGQLSKYLYCYDRSRITLLGVFELKDGAWSEIN